MDQPHWAVYLLLLEKKNRKILFFYACMAEFHAKPKEGMCENRLKLF
jgi:hypothetical protein